jgi:parallel beta-helix repeat protein
MNTNLRKLRYLSALLLFTAMPFQLMAAQFTVNSTADPAVGDPSNCSVGTATCTFRDALAAADQTPDFDSVVFDLSKDIYLNKALTALHPVVIDGGGTTTLRIAQGYNVVTLPDHPFFGDEDVLVVQPDYFSEKGGKRAMLQVFGQGTVIANLKVDGSITPPASDIGLARLDFESDGSTDAALYTVNKIGGGPGVRWLVAGGIETTGSATVRDNKLHYFNNNAVTVETSAYSSVLNNEIAGGASGQTGFAAEGVFAYGSIHTVVSGNSISDYRVGVKFLYSSSMEISNNEMKSNVTGLDLDQVGPDFGENRVVENVFKDSHIHGISIRAAAFIGLDGNEITGSGEVGVIFKGSGEISLADNEIKENGSGDREHGGILISEGSRRIRLDSNEISFNNGYGVSIAASVSNELADNEIKNNAGAGIVLLFGAADNQVLSNEVKGNFVGILSGLEHEIWFPNSNHFQDNQLKMNVAVDAVDYDLDCNDTWIGNTINTAFFASAGCIDQ